MSNIFKFLDRPFVTLNILSTCIGMPATKCCYSGPTLIKRKQANIFCSCFFFGHIPIHDEIQDHLRLSPLFIWRWYKPVLFYTTGILRLNILECILLHIFIHRKTRAFKSFILIHKSLLVIYKFEGLKFYTPFRRMTNGTPFVIRLCVNNFSIENL